MATRSNTMPTCSTSPALVTDFEADRELRKLMNTYGVLATNTPHETDATIQSVREGLAAFRIRLEAYQEAMTRLRIGGCHRSANDRRFMPKAPVIIDECKICESEIRAAEYHQRQAQIPPPRVDEVTPLSAEQLVELDVIRARLRKSTNPMPKEPARGHTQSR